MEVARRERCVLCQLPLGAQTPSGGRQERAPRSVPTSTGCSDTQWRSSGERAAFCANFHWVLRHPVEVARRESCVLCQLPLGAQTPRGGGARIAAFCANFHWVLRHPVEVSRRESRALCRLPLGAQIPTGGGRARQMISLCFEISASNLKISCFFRSPSSENFPFPADASCRTSLIALRTPCGRGMTTETLFETRTHSTLETLR